LALVYLTTFANSSLMGTTIRETPKHTRKNIETIMERTSTLALFGNFNERTQTDYLVVHHTATPASMFVDAQKIHQWHTGQGWDAIGYHIVIQRDGTPEVGRPLKIMGAHVQGFNNRSLGIAMVGGLAADGTAVDDFTEAQYKTLQFVLILLKEIYPGANVVKHKELADTLCNEVNMNKLEDVL